MRTLILISLIIFQYTCTPAPPKTNRPELKLTINQNYQKFLGRPHIQHNISDSSYYDTLKGGVITSFREVKKGFVSVLTFSLLTENLEYEVDLNNNAIVEFDTTLYSRLTSVSPENFIATFYNFSDTIFVGRRIRGCSGGSIEKMRVTKSDSIFTIYYYQDKENSVVRVLESPDNKFKKYYLAFLKESEKDFKELEQKENGPGTSTISIGTYIRKGNNFIELPPYSWRYFEDLKKDLGLKPTE